VAKYLAVANAAVGYLNAEHWANLISCRKTRPACRADRLADLPSNDPPCSPPSDLNTPVRPARIKSWYVADQVIDRCKYFPRSRHENHSSQPMYAPSLRKFLFGSRLALQNFIFCPSTYYCLTLAPRLLLMSSSNRQTNLTFYFSIIYKSGLAALERQYLCQRF